MLQRNLIYKSITRAKKIVILIGDSNALKYVIKNDVLNNRKTLLKEIFIKKFE